MHDNEIIKALKEEIHLVEYVDGFSADNVSLELLKNVLDLINRQKAEIERLKAADVVEVVRCKDCKYRKTEDCAMFYECNCGEQHTWENDNDFCSYGERKELDNDT